MSTPLPDAELPSGILVFLFTDVEDSTPRWEAAPDDMRQAINIHDEILRREIAAKNGVVFKNTGDGVAAVFGNPEHAASAAIACQRALQASDWNGIERLKVRMGLHMGEAQPTRGDYYGPPVNRAARVMDVANGDQIAISGVVSRFLSSFARVPMGDHQLKGIGTEQIDLLTADDLVTDDRPLRSRVGVGARSLPEVAQRIIGRESEIENLVGLCEDNRVITVIGPGGVGKTRLALEIGRQRQHAHADGAVFCELGTISEPEAVVEAVAAALGARPQPGLSLSASIVNYLEGRNALVILDNCEHVADEVRLLADQLLAATSTSLLLTSREPLGVAGEQLFGLRPLDASSAGVELFLERALERDQSFRPTAGDHDLIRSVCERLDGVPLAIELAAAWVRVLSPQDLLDRLEDRFQVLRSGRSGGRHTTLRDTVRWSYEMLDEKQATLFDRLSVFVGGFSLDSVMEVCADHEPVEGRVEIHPDEVLDIVMSLVDKSMVMSERGAGHIRFSMLGILRQFGQERLDDRGTSTIYRTGHADHYRALVHDQADLLVTSKEAEVWELLDREWANIRASFETLLLQDRLEGAAGLLLDVGWYATLSLRTEAFAWAEEVARHEGFDSLDSAASIHGLRAIRKYISVASDGSADAEAGLAIDPSDPYGFCRLALTSVSLNNVHVAENSERWTADWIDSLGDDSPDMSRLWALGMRTFHLCTNAPSPEAAVHAAEMVAIAESSGSASAQALARWANGMVETFSSMEAGLRQWRLGLDAARSITDVHLLVHLIVGLELHFSATRGDLDDVLAKTLDGLRRAHAQHYLSGTSHLFGVSAIVLSRVGMAPTGARLIGSMVANGHLPRENAIRAIDKALGPDAESAKNDGASLSTNDAASLAIATLEDVVASR